MRGASTHPPRGGGGLQSISSVSADPAHSGSPSHLLRGGSPGSETVDGFTISPARGPANTAGTHTTITPPSPPTSGITFTQISTGYEHSLAIGSDGNTYAWGQNTYGQLGDGTNAKRNIPVLVHAPAGVRFTQVSAGNDHSLAIGDDGHAYSWGSNFSGELGDGSQNTGPGDHSADKNTPVRVKDPAGHPNTTWKTVSAGELYSIGIASDGHAYSWGKNDRGELGDGSSASKNTPVRVKDPAGHPNTTWKAVSAGFSHSLGIASDGHAYGWGSNSSGELGNGSNGTSSSDYSVDKNTPVPVKDPAGHPNTTWKTVSAGYYLSLGIDSDGHAYGWGWNSEGQVGDGSKNTGPGDSSADKNTPVRVKDPAPNTIWKAISAGGGSHSLALDSDGHAYGWGFGSRGQLGTGSVVRYSTKPVRVKDPAPNTTWTSISAGEDHSLGISDGKAYAWGDNGQGQLGVSKDSSGIYGQTTRPVRVASPRYTITGVTAAGAAIGAGDRSVDPATGAWDITLPSRAPDRRNVTVDYRYDGLDGNNNVVDGSPGSVTLHYTYFAPYTVRFSLGEAAGHIPSPTPADQTVYSDDPQPVAEPSPAPSWEHHWLTGWYTDAGAAWNFGTPVTSSMTLTARWQAYAFTLRPSSGPSAGGNTLSLTAPDPPAGSPGARVAVTGVDIDGRAAPAPAWDGAGRVWKLTAPAHTHGRVPVTVHWTVDGRAQPDYELSYGYLDRYTVSFGLGGAPGAAPASQTFTEGSGKAAARPQNPSWAGHEFAGWFTGDGRPFDFSEPVGADASLTARWDSYTLSMEPRKGPKAGGTPVSVSLAGRPGVRFTQVSAGDDFTAALGSDGFVYGWGANNKGQLGDGGGPASTVPVRAHTPAGLTFTQISAGPQTVLALASDGSVYGWGVNWGQLGDNSETNRSTPVRFATPAGVAVTRVSTGSYHTLAVDQDGRIWAAGANTAGQLGTGDTSKHTSPVRVDPPAGHRFTDAAAGQWHSLAATEDGRLHAWGGNGSGQQGFTGSGPNNPQPVSLPGGARASRVAASGNTSAAVTDDGRLLAWGGNDHGQLGDGTTTDNSTPGQVALPGGANARRVALGSGYTLALTDDGRLFAWGGNDHGQLGDNSTRDATRPQAVDNPAGVGYCSLSAGKTHSAAVGIDGQVRGWGGNDKGQLGDGTTTDRPEPADALPPAATIDAVSFDRSAATGGYNAASGRWTGTSPAHAAGGVDVTVTWSVARDGRTPKTFPYRYLDRYTIDFDLGGAPGRAPASQSFDEGEGRHAAWPDPPQWSGHGFAGWFTSDGRPYDFNRAVNAGTRLTARWDRQSFSVTPASGPAAGDRRVDLTGPGAPGVRFTRTAGGAGFSLALGSDGNIYAWGKNDKGQLGDGTTTDRPTPVRVHAPAGVTFTALAAGASHAIAVGSDGKAYAWGINYGQLGDGSDINRPLPVTFQTPAGVSVTQVAAGFYHSLALGDDGKIYAAGFNGSGQLGAGDTATRKTPVAVAAPAGRRFVDIGAGKFHSLAITDQGRAYAWGANGKGQLGTTGGATSSPQAVAMPANVAFAQITAGDDYSAAVSDTGALYTWGGNASGQLGDGTTTDKTGPTKISLPGDPAVQAIAAGGSHMIALTDDGTLYTWGANTGGQLGDGTTTGTASPQRLNLPGGATGAGPGAGSAHSLATDSSGQVYTWGANAGGQLGDGTTTGRTRPGNTDQPTVNVHDLKLGGTPVTGLVRDSPGHWHGLTGRHDDETVDAVISWDTAGADQADYTIRNAYTYQPAFTLVKAGRIPLTRLAGLTLMLTAAAGYGCHLVGKHRRTLAQDGKA
ncbi:RCC1 domain-containing protein [Bifidobacterium xylocopae]|nr:InlB B-repeat-containing protein [Bifidobacterium xylocopae]